MRAGQNLNRYFVTILVCWFYVPYELMHAISGRNHEEELLDVS